MMQTIYALLTAATVATGQDSLQAKVAACPQLAPEASRFCEPLRKDAERYQFGKGVAYAYSPSRDALSSLVKEAYGVGAIGRTTNLGREEIVKLNAFIKESEAQRRLPVTYRA